MTTQNAQMVEEATFEITSLKDLDGSEVKECLETLHFARIRGLISADEIDHAMTRIGAFFSPENDRATTGEAADEVRGNFQKLSIGRANHGGVDRPRFMRCFYSPLWNEDALGMHGPFRQAAGVRNWLSGKELDYAIDDPNGAAWTAARIHHFPAGGGFMVDHQDTVLPALYKDNSLGAFFQPLIVMSQKGVDFHEGGGFAMVAGERIQYEDYCEKGDIVIYDTSTVHGVDDIDPRAPYRQDSLAGRMSGLVTLYKTLD